MFYLLSWRNDNGSQGLRIHLYGGMDANYKYINLVSDINEKNVVTGGIDVRPYLTNGTNHLAAGRQGGIWQLWINGTRVYRANNSTNAENITESFNRFNIFQLYTNGNNTFVLNDVRLTPNVRRRGRYCSYPCRRGCLDTLPEVRV